MKIILTLFFIIFFACAYTTNEEESFSTDWNIFRGNPSLTACTSVSLSDNPALLWTFQSNVNTRSSLVVFNGVAYWSSSRGRIFGVNSEGEQVFDFEMETAVDAPPMVHDSVLYIGRIDGKLCAISLEKQDILWNFETLGQIVASPNWVPIGGKDFIIVGSYDHFLYIIDSKTGEEIKRFESRYYINGAVAQYDNYVVWGGCDGWLRNENSAFVSVPAVSDKMVFVVSDDQKVYAMKRKEGAIAWEYLLKGKAGEGAPVICKNKLLVCTKTGIVSMQIHSIMCCVA
ncbi:MAG: PQQ-like beta-propeller repeat protein [Lentimicrobiaceae bacterium]|nr:PQQ-like beta-propeller repeat protein [Lentimicrobiaceae bacterium]